MSRPLEIERNELGYQLELIREDRSLRVVHRPCEESEVCVFFVHGGGGRAGQFKHLIRRLENTVNIVAFDFLGHGDSPHINDTSLYTSDQHLQDLGAVFDKYQRRKNVYVCHSYGNIHVLRHLKVLQDRGDLSAIVGVAMIGLGVNAPVSIGLFGKLPCFVLEWLRPFARSASNAALFASDADPELIRFENGISDNNRMYTMRTIGVDCSDQAAWDRWLAEGKEVLVGNHVPRMLVTGTEDGVFPPSSAEKLKELFGIGEERYHLLEGAGHVPMLERGEEVGRIIAEFFRELGITSEETCP